MGDMIPISTPELLYKYLAIAVVPVGYGSDKSTTSNMVPLQDALTALILIIASYVAHLIWSRRRVQRGIANIPAPKSVSFWTGNLPLLYDPQRGWPFLDSIQDACSVFRLTTPIGFNDMIYVADPSALYTIFKKDEALFEEREGFMLIKRILFGAHSVLVTEGHKHRKQRKFLNPVFSMGNIKRMLPIFFGVSHTLRESLRSLTTNGAVEVDMLSWLTRTALEMIGQAGVGQTLDSLAIEETSSAYGTAIKEGISALSLPSLRIGAEYLLPLASRMCTPRTWKYIIDRLPLQDVRRTKNMVDEIERTSREIYEAKKITLAKGDESTLQQVAEKDLISLLMRANMSASGEDRLEDEEVVAQISCPRSFVFAATDTTSSALCRTLSLLAEHPAAQERLREEIVKALHICEGGESRYLSHDEIQALQFLDAVCRETLRLYTPTPHIDRRALEDTVLPLDSPITDVHGTEIHEIFIPKDTVLTIGIASMNRSAKLWGPDAMKWKPERWMEELPESVLSARLPGIYSNLMTFGAGKNSCPGFRFSQFEMKAVLCDLISAFRFSPSPRHSKVIFSMSIIASPTVDGKPSLPLILEAVTPVV
ncbi:cytochrome P450 [Stereum hirsutum FP-91666 SS1]|uniref:cytochrome P450 n=1 Tax=Stereum hirsutum (strain FP-91666) TaxID=721885 RepID=UPI000440D2BC|nr:cytochrome P450 [Stereum hirsutum FP-91666 SS1]EIM88079.1 cytochrome P450 [Stereum hirsutum FP-91666 SS1]